MSFLFNMGFPAGVGLRFGELRRGFVGRAPSGGQGGGGLYGTWCPGGQPLPKTHRAGREKFSPLFLEESYGLMLELAITKD